MIVAGCGPTVYTVKPPSVPTIGVNDVCRHFIPTYLLVIDKPQKFEGDRFHYIKNCPSVVFHAERHNPTLANQVERSVLFKIVKAKYGQVVMPKDGVFSAFKDCPYAALQLALWMGATEIGFIGVDHTGDHPKLGRLAFEITAQYKLMKEFLEEKDVRLVKLAEQSRLPFDYVPYEEWNA